MASDLLFQQAKARPDDETRLGALADCYEEEGRSERVRLVQELIAAQQKVRDVEYLLPAVDHALLKQVGPVAMAT